MTGLQVAAGLFEHPGFLMTYAVLQAGAMLLLTRFLDLYEREPAAVVALVALWGATGAAMIAAAANEALISALDPDAAVVYGNAIVPPLIEEASKGVALVAVFLVSYWAGGRLGVFEFNGLTDGLVYGAAVGIGFAFTEDFVFFVNEAQTAGFQEGVTVFVERRDFFGPSFLHHALFSGAFGAALGLATWFWERGWAVRLGLPILGLALAVVMHAVNNGLVELRLVRRFGIGGTAEWIRANRPERDVSTTSVDDEALHRAADAPQALLQILDWAYLGLFALAVWFWLAYQRAVIRSELREEVDSGLIAEEERETVSRYWRRSRRYWRLLWRGELDELVRLRRLHGYAVELAFVKWRWRGRPETPRIARYRRRIADVQRARMASGFLPAVKAR